MAEITAKLVKELREKSGAGVMDAKKALVETDGDIEKAIELLREKGMAKAAKKADRVAAEGLTGVYVNGNVAAVVEVNAETDFVAKNAQFVELVNATAKVIAEGKPANNEEALALTMPSGETLEAAYVSATATIGEKISFRRFALIEKTDAQHFGAYQHNGGRIGVISVIDGGDDALAEFFQRALHDADGSVHARAEAVRIGEHDGFAAHEASFCVFSDGLPCFLWVKLSSTSSAAPTQMKLSATLNAG